MPVLSARKPALTYRLIDGYAVKGPAGKRPVGAVVYVLLAYLGKRRRTTTGAAKVRVWGTADVADDTLSKACRRANQALVAVGSRDRVGIDRGAVLLLAGFAPAARPRGRGG